MPEPSAARRRHVHRLSQATPYPTCGGKRCAAPRRVHPMLADLLQARSHGHGRRFPAHTASTWVTGSTWYIPATSAHARDRTAARTSGDPFSTWRAHQRGARPCEPAPRDAPLSTPASRGPSWIPSGSPAAPEPSARAIQGTDRSHSSSRLVTRRRFRSLTYGSTPCTAGERAASALPGSDALETATGLRHFR